MAGAIATTFYKFTCYGEDVKITRTVNIGSKKITVISNFFKNYDKVLYRQTIEKAIKNSEEILKNILKI